MSRPPLVLALVAATLAAPGCGGSSPKSGALTWAGKVQVFRPKMLPRDRIVFARVRNSGKSTLHLIAARMVVRDADGSALKGSSAAFTHTFAHGLFGAYQQPNPVPVAELLRLGKAIYLPPGASAPFYAAWHVAPGTHEPIRIDYGSGSLTVPRGPARPTAP